MRPEFPLPDVGWEPTAPFWEGAAAGELRLPRCDACGSFNWYPSARCRACGAEDFTWQATSGRGSLFSWTVVRHAFLAPFAGKVPYVTGLVSLEEDPSVRLATELVDCDPQSLEHGMPVEVVFRQMSFEGVEGTVTAPYFVPSRGALP